MDKHFSWVFNKDCKNINQELNFIKKNKYNSGFVERYQSNSIPEYNLSKLDLNNPIIHNDISNSFKSHGLIVLKNVYSKSIMERYNQWCIEFKEIAKNDPNCIHPKHKHKFLINDICGRMGESNPELLITILKNKELTTTIDILLGFAKVGSMTGHWLEPGGDRQLSHVDYPIHLGSSKFWGNNLDKVMKYTTKFQINEMLTNYSLQVLIASDNMDVSNGSTEVVPFSHQIKNLDFRIHDKNIYNEFEKYFINTELQQGDILIFNRRLCHRGGKNISPNRRNSLIIQFVWLWGVGQEIIEYGKIKDKIEESEFFKMLSLKEQEELVLRLNPPYPNNIKLNT